MSTVALRALKDKYARILGERECAEQAVECEQGVENILAAWKRIDLHKRELSKSLYHLAAVIRLFDPEFDVRAIEPIAPVQRQAANGTISQEAYSILGDADRWLRTREISRLVAERLGRELENRTLARLDSAIHNAFTPYVERGLISVSSTSPKLWRLAELAQCAGEPSEPVEDHDAANSPSSARMQASWPRPGRPRRTGRRY